jgi:hypothetical protein
MSVPPVRAAKTNADDIRKVHSSPEKKPPAKRYKAAPSKDVERPEPTAEGNTALFNLFAQIRWPDLQHTPDDGSKSLVTTTIPCIAHGGENDEKDETVNETGAAQLLPANAHPMVTAQENIETAYAQAMPRTDQARLEELQSLMQKLSARMASTGDSSDFVVALSQPLFAGTSIAVRMRDQRFEVEYHSSEAAEADWFEDHTGKLTERIESALKRRVHMRRRPDEPES